MSKLKSCTTGSMIVLSQPGIRVASYISNPVSHVILLSHVSPVVYSLYFKYLYCILVLPSKYTKFLQFSLVLEALASFHPGVTKL